MRLTELEGGISLMLNFMEDDNKKLHDLIRKMLNDLGRGNEGDGEFVATYPEVLALSRDILIREWNRVKQEIPMS